MTPSGPIHLADSAPVPLEGTAAPRFLSLAVSPQNDLWAVGTGGSIFVSRDGKRFSRVASGTRRTLYRIEFDSERSGTIVAWGGLRLQTRDGGQTWAVSAPSRFSGTERILQSIDRSGDLLGWAVGELRGTVLRTRNGGASWETVPTGSAVRLHDLAFANDNDGFVAGADGTILVTSDGGSTWRTHRIGEGTWRAVDARPGGIAVVVGDAGSAVGTVDCGITWHRIRTREKRALLAVKLLGHFHGYAGGEGGALLRFG